MYGYWVGAGEGIPGRYWGGYTGYYPASLKAEPRYSGAGPGSPTGAGVGGIWVQRPPELPGTTLRARSVPCGALPVPGTSPASWPIVARFDLISQIISQNGKVSPEKCQKAYVSPCFQNWLQKSPLDFLRFPYSESFSHKELMGRFDPTDHVHCQNDEVSTVCTPDGHAKGAVRYPHGRR